MNKRFLILIGLFLVGILLIRCTPAASGDENGRNPLTDLYDAGQMLEYVSSLQIRADVNKKPIENPMILRAIDRVLVEAKALQEDAYERRDAGTSGVFYGVNDNFAAGPVLLERDGLSTDYEFDVSAAPDIVVYLAANVAPHTKEELFSESTIEVGQLQSFRGAQHYSFPLLTEEEMGSFRTIVLYSKSMEQVIALAQLQ